MRVAGVVGECREKFPQNRGGGSRRIGSERKGRNVEPTSPAGPFATCSSTPRRPGSKAHLKASRKPKREPDVLCYVALAKSIPGGTVLNPYLQYRRDRGLKALRSERKAGTKGIWHKAWGQSVGTSVSDKVWRQSVGQAYPTKCGDKVWRQVWGRNVSDKVWRQGAEQGVEQV